jgi:hypothetical protein
LKDRLFPGGAENNLYMFIFWQLLEGVRERVWDGVISRPPAGALWVAPAAVRE